MVERLKQAIEKARVAREGQSVLSRATALTSTMPDVARHWSDIASIDPARIRLEPNRIVSVDRSHPAHAEFDRLRTRLLKICRDNGWSEIIVTSPTRGCGKTMVASNLAFSIARNQTLRTLLVDLDMRVPSLHRVVDHAGEHGIDDLLTGRIEPKDLAMRIWPNLAVCLGNRRITDSSELLQKPESLKQLAALRRYLAPDITLYDMPPLFGCDDTLGFLPNADAVLLVAGAGATTPSDIEECQRLMASAAPLLGVVLNKVVEDGAGEYAYGETPVSA